LHDGSRFHDGGHPLGNFTQSGFFEALAIHLNHLLFRIKKFFLIPPLPIEFGLNVTDVDVSQVFHETVKRRPFPGFHYGNGVPTLGTPRASILQNELLQRRIERQDHTGPKTVKLSLKRAGCDQNNGATGQSLPKPPLMAILCQKIHPVTPFDQVQSQL
jgi:hypothetical protein